jgi:hypothetical protein
MGPGGAIYIKDYEVEINNTTISNNSATSYGGGITIISSTVNITQSEISNNTTTTSEGAGLYINDESTVAISNSTIANNEVLADNNTGGGIASYGFVTLENVDVINNIASNGSGVRVGTKTFAMTGGSISGNISDSGSQEGGALQIQDAISVSLDSVEFSENQYNNGVGSAIGIRRTDTDITNCVISNNSSGRGAIYIHDADVDIARTLIADNISSNTGNNYGAIFADTDANYSLNYVTFANNEQSAIHNNSNTASGTIINTIFWNPTADERCLTINCYIHRLFLFVLTYAIVVLIYS